MNLYRKVRQNHNFGSINNSLRNETGVIDLASIMVGIIVIGLIGGVIAATVFTVIPWTQDQAAKEQLVSLHSAQNSYFGLSSDPSASLPAGLPANSFLDSPGLEAAGLMAQGSNYCTVPTNGGHDYDAYVKSGSGKIFKSSNGNKTPVEMAPGFVITGSCSFITDVLGTPITCGDGKYIPVGNVTLSCVQNGPWGAGGRVQHVITVTPTSPTLGHWKVMVDISAITTLTGVKVSGPSGYSPTIGGKDMGNVSFSSSKFTVEGNTNNNPSASANNHWDISTAKNPETVLIDINYS